MKKIMIGDALRVHIESYAAHRNRNPLLHRAETGTLTKSMVMRYVANVHFVISITPAYLIRARDRARALHDEKLAAYFHKKLGEETGHEVWAERDLESMTKLITAPPNISVAPSTRLLVEHLAKKIDEDPALYLSYITFSEYITVMVGPEWVRVVEEQCGIPRTSMTVVDNHIELDREHAEEAFDAVDDLVVDPTKLAPMREMLIDCIDLFNALCSEIADTADTSDVENDDNKHEHAVSAA